MLRDPPSACGHAAALFEATKPVVAEEGAGATSGGEAVPKKLGKVRDGGEELDAVEGGGGRRM